MIDKLLALAAVEHRQRIEHPESVGVAALIDEAVAGRGAEARAGRGRASASGASRRRHGGGRSVPAAAGAGEPARNAIDFAPPAARSRSRRIAMAAVCARVADRGPGVPDYRARTRVRALLFVAAPGWRQPQQRPGPVLGGGSRRAAWWQRGMANRDGGGAVEAWSYRRFDST